MALFLRFFVIGFAFLVSYFAGAFVVGYGLTPPQLLLKIDAGTNFYDVGLFMVFLFFAAAAGIVTATYIFALSSVAILIAEILSLRSALYYALAGPLIGALAYFMSDVAARVSGKGTVVPFTQELQWLAVAGIVGGFIYWLIAGRSAGMVFSARKGI